MSSLMMLEPNDVETKRALAERFIAEQTLFIVKPDAQPVRDELLMDLLRESFSLRHFTQTSGPIVNYVWEQHYCDLEDESFFPDLISFMVTGPVTVMVLERPLAIRTARAMLGATKILNAAPGTLRHRYARYSAGTGPSTLFHASDSAESAQREIELWNRVCGWQ